jgi:hypothetical protein
LRAWPSKCPWAPCGPRFKPPTHHRLLESRQARLDRQGHGDVGDADYERIFREEFAAAGLKVSGDPTNLFQQDDKSADLQVGALVTSLSARFCRDKTLKEAFADSRH